MEEIELCSFELINAAAEAMDFYTRALAEAKKGNAEKSSELIAEGERCFLKGHHAHARLLKKESNLEDVAVTLLLVHAEDQMMLAENMKQRVKDLSECYAMIEELRKEVYEKNRTDQ